MDAITREGASDRWSRQEGGAMRALVVYESMFGNTRNVALAIAEGIGTRMTVEAVEIA
jgi:flavorubredoxin